MPCQFEKQIQYLVDHNFDILTISDYLNLEQTQKTIALTFDDGYDSVFQHAFPILKKYNVPATVFINPAFVGQFNTWDANFGRRFRHMDWQQLRVLSVNGWEIGSHGMTHRDLTILPNDVMEKELKLSAEIIKRNIGTCSPVLSYPFGNVNEDVAISAQKLNYKFGLSMGMHCQNVALHFTIRRTGIYRIDARVFYQLKVFAKFNSFFRFIQVVLDKCSDVTVVYKRKNWSLY